MSRRKILVAIVSVALAVFAAAAALFLEIYLPQKVAAVIADKFGEDVHIGGVRYVFPMTVELRDVTVAKKPGFFLSGDASRVRVKLRAGAAFSLRLGGALIKEITADGFKLYVYPIKGPRKPALITRVTPAPSVTPMPSDTPPPREDPAMTRKWEDVPDAAAPAASPSVPRAGGGSRLRRQKPWYAGLNFTFRLTRGEAIFRGDGRDVVILRDVAAQGKLDSAAFSASLTGNTAVPGAFALKVAHAFPSNAGSAEYRVAAVDLEQLLPLAGKPKYVVRANGTLTFTGWVNWGRRRLDHRATGQLSGGRITLAPGRVTFVLGEVATRFTLHNRAVTFADGTCRAAGVRWHFSGTADGDGLDISFQSENMLLQNLITMFAGDVAVTFGGEGVARFRITGAAAGPDFYLRVEKKGPSTPGP